MKYEVVKKFVDLQDNNYMYRVGDSFPRAGMTVSDERIAELASTQNRQGAILIKPVEEPEPVEESKKSEKGKGKK